MEYLWKITLCAILFGVVLILAGEGSGAEVTRIVCACGMVLTVFGMTPNFNAYKELMGSDRLLIENGIRQGEDLRREQARNGAELALTQLLQSQLKEAEVTVHAAYDKEHLVVTKVQLLVPQGGSHEKIIQKTEEILGVGKEKVQIIEK